MKKKAPSRTHPRRKRIVEGMGRDDPTAAHGYNGTGGAHPEENRLWKGWGPIPASGGDCAAGGVVV